MPEQRFLAAIAAAQERQAARDAQRQRRQSAITQERAQAAIRAFRSAFVQWFGKDTLNLLPQPYVIESADAAGLSAHLRFAIHGCACTIGFSEKRRCWTVASCDREPIPVPLGEIYLSKERERIDIMLCTIADVLDLSPAVPAPLSVTVEELYS